MPDKDKYFVLFPHRELIAFARLVRDLRAVQRSSGLGYKTPTARSSAATFEKRIDEEITKILGA